MPLLRFLGVVDKVVQSGMLYSLAIEPLLNKLQSKISKISWRYNYTAKKLGWNSRENGR